MTIMHMVSACSFFTKSQEVTSENLLITTEAQVQQKQAQKYLAYTEVDLYISDKLERSLRFYFNKFGSGEELVIDTINANMENGVFLDLTKYDRMLQQSAQYPEQEPSMDRLDEAAAALIPKLRELTATVLEVDTYYKMKSYVDDDMEMGKVLHRRLYAMHLEVSPLIQRFEEEYVQHFRSFSSQRMEILNQKDEQIRYYSLKSIVSAIELAQALPPQGANFNAEAKLDRELVERRYGILVKDMNQFQMLSKDRERLMLEGVDTSFAYMNDFKSALIGLKAAATDVKLAIIAGALEQENSGGAALGKDVFQLFRIQIKESILQYWSALENGI